MALKFWAVARGRALGGAMLVVASLGTGRGSAQSPGSAIPDELAVIAAACRENSARIETLQLSGTVVVTGRQCERQWDPIAGQTYNSQTREFTVWKDALNWRLDVTADREVDGATGEVIYNLPAYEHITSYARLAREGGLDALKRKYGTPRSTTRTIVTPDKDYQYTPESNQLNIDNPHLGRAVNEEPEMQFVLNKTLRGSTLAEFLDRWAELAQRGDRSIDVTPLGDGQYRIRSTVIAQREDQQMHSYVLDAVVDLDKGGNVLSQLYQSDGQIVETGQFEYMNAGGAWVVAHAEIAAMFGPDGVPKVNGVYDVRPESVRINQPIDPQVFSFEGLAVRRGADVHDHKTGEEYLYDDVPIHVKVALAQAREREEELAEAAAALAAQSPPAAPADASAPKPPAGQAGPPAVAAAVPTARATSGPSSIVVVTPQTRAAPPADTMPAEAPVATRPVLKVQAAQQDNPTQPAPPAAGRSMMPGAAVTAAVVTGGCAGALGIGIWKLLRRGAKPRAG